MSPLSPLSVLEDVLHKASLLRGGLTDGGPECIMHRNGQVLLEGADMT